MRQAIIVTSFGTSYEKALNGAIGGIERAVARAYPAYEIVRAFTSGRIIAKLGRMGIAVETLPQAIARLRGEGFEALYILPTHIVAGIEYEKVLRASEGLPCATPFLYEEDDYAFAAKLLCGIADTRQGTTLFMGHGTEHAVGESYGRLGGMLADNVMLSCVEGDLSLDALLPRLDTLRDKRITLSPFMIVAGDHAHNDLAGEDADSWKSRLEARGFAVSLRLRGLGEMPQVQDRFVKKIGGLLS